MLNSPSREQWEQLYTLADRIKALAPWNDLFEDELFGVRDPVTGEDYFISVMGQGGDHYAIGVYVGALALHQFWAVHDVDDEEMAIQMLLTIRQLQLTFEDREMLENFDRAVIKQLGRKYRGRAAWPTFRSFKPGYLPWQIDAAEADALICALEQTVDVLARAADDETLLEPVDEDSYLMRIPETQTDGVVWRDQVVKIPPPPMPELEIQLDAMQLEAARKLPRQKQRTLEVDIATLPEPIVGEDGRPFLASLLLVVDHQSGMVLASELLPQGETPMHTIAGALQMLLDKFTQWGWLPNAVNVRHDMAKELLAPLSNTLKIKLNVARNLSMLDEAMDFLFARFGGQMLEDLDDDEDDDASPPIQHRRPR
jgi:hypothetical protein